MRNTLLFAGCKFHKSKAQFQLITYMISDNER